MNKKTHLFTLFTLVGFLLALSSCNTSKNTASVRFWKGFKAKYNTYYNGHQAYLEGMKLKREKNKDNYLEPLPLFMVGNENARGVGSPNFETAVTKCEKAIQLYSINKKPTFPKGHKLTAKEKAMKNQTEFNPFIKNAWILMGMAQFQKGDFVDAAATFAYTVRLYNNQPDVREMARALQAISYIEMEWYYDAEDLLDKVRRAGIPKSSQRYYNMALADLNLHRKNWKEALPYVEKEVKNMRHGIEKARGYFLLAQIYKMLDMKEKYYKAFPDAPPMLYFRPPSGNCNNWVLTYAEKLGYVTALYSFAYNDWDTKAQPDLDAAFENLKIKLHPGCVYLFHTVSSTNAKLIPMAIDWIREQGYEILPLCDIEA